MKSFILLVRLAGWAGKLGAELSEFGDYVTRKQEVLEVREISQSSLDFSEILHRKHFIYDIQSPFF